MEQKLNKNGREMRQKWDKKGLKMDQKWTDNGAKLTRKLIFFFRCPKSTCETCLDTFEVDIATYDCDYNCGNCGYCEGNMDSISVCKYCVEGESNCARLCKQGKVECLQCADACGL